MANYAAIDILRINYATQTFQQLWLYNKNMRNNKKQFATFIGKNKSNVAATKNTYEQK